MMNSRWQANKIGLINFWYYDEQEFPFVKGRMLLRGSNGSGKSVTMQSVVPLLLDGNMSPERLDPFGSRDRKMSSYLLEEDDGREERTGYLYLEFKRQDSDTYLTIGMGIRARKGKNLDKWYFSLTDGRRVGKDFFLYKDTGEKVTLSKKELENRIGTGGRVIDRQADYMEYVNRQIFGFETAEEYKEMIDLLIQLRTPKLSKDFKPSVINDILSDSLQPLSDDDLRPMSEAIENMDTMNMNLKNRKEAKQAAEKIQGVFSKYNQKLLYEKADRYEQAEIKLENARTQQKEQEKKLSECRQNIEKLQAEHQELDAKHESMEKERESLNKSDAVALKRREAELTTELEGQQKNLREKQHFLELKQEQYQDAQNQIKAEEDRKYEKEKELEELIEEMQDEADIMAFEEHAFMKEELEKLEYRSKKALEGKVRIMAIGEYDCCACCGTHVQKAGEIGMVKILSAQNYKGGTRLEIVCGMRALADYDEKTENAAAISEMLSVPTGKIAKATEALLKERDELKQIISRMKWEKINNIAEKVGETPKACVFAADFDSKDMVHLADTILDKTGGTAAVFAPAGTGYAFVLMSRTEDMRPMAAEMKEAFGSKGGGKPEAVQGRTEAKEKELKGFFAEKGYVMF